MIRRSNSQDGPQIRALLGDAFAPSRYEVRLRDLVVAGKDPCFEWVMEDASGLAAHILFTPALRGKERIGWHLAPVAVRAEAQRQGLGSHLIRHALAQAELCEDPVFVLGDPSYYERFGFRPVVSARCPFDPGNEHFRGWNWQDMKEEFDVGYLPAFIEAGESEPGAL